MFGDLHAYCMFLGYPRSGHTLIGSLLNAHPDVLICNELDALGSVKAGATRRELFDQILARDEDFAARNRTWFYDYAVPGEGSWQGRWRRLRVLGDKLGGGSSLRLYKHPELLDALSEVVRLPLRILHVVRSPWDNIATIACRGGTLAEAVTMYFKQCESVRRVRARRPTLALLDVYYEDFVADPRRGLRELCDFLGVERDEAWVECCCAIVYGKPHRSRFAIAWPEAVADRVRAGIDRFPWFRPEHRDFGAPAREEMTASRDPRG